jgi:hypothetical protein
LFSAPLHQPELLRSSVFRYYGLLSDCEAALKLKPDNQLAAGLRDMARSKIKF